MSLAPTRSHKLLFAALVLAGLTACTSINSGLQSGELPPTGTFVADNGITFNVQPLSLANLPPSPLYSNGYNSSNGLKNSRVRELLSAPKKNDYRIAAGDILSINLVGYPQIPQSESGYPVDQQGYIQFPLIGRIKAAGSNVPQFTTDLRTQLQRYLKHPDPQVNIANYRGKKFFIDGAVNKAGEYTIDDRPVSLYSALSMAGGTALNGDSNSIVLTRNGLQYELGLRDLQTMGISPSQIYLKHGDTLHINSKDRNKIFVLGEFGSIQPLEIPDQGLSLAHVIGQSGGLNSTTADAAKVYVVRDHGQTSYTDIYYVNLKTITNLTLANRFEMQPNDIVYVDPTGLTRWNRFLNSILPSASAIERLN